METMSIEEQQKERIQDMVGKTFMYRARTIKVRGCNVIDGEVRIQTQSHPVITNIAGLGDTLDEFLPVQGEPQSLTITGEENALAMHKNSNTLNSLEEVLMQNINKLKEDPNYIDQAKEIANHAGKIIDISKTKVEMVKEMRKASQF